MEYTKREYPLFSACGLNCGLCPRYQMHGSSKCPGCVGEGFMMQHPLCGVLSCCERRGLTYCFQCADYPCKKYGGADQSDSFITHLWQLRDLNRAKEIGMDEYKKELDEKVSILEMLLANYDDGRHKSMYCLAVNLLDLQDVRDVMEQVRMLIQAELPVKEQAKMVTHLFESIAEARGITLKLRKKSEEK